MCSIVHFNSFTSKKSLFTTINRLKIFIYYFACVLIAEIIGYCVSGSVHILINARAVTEKLHSVDSCLLLVEYQKQIEQKNWNSFEVCAQLTDNFWHFEGKDIDIS